MIEEEFEQTAHGMLAEVLMGMPEALQETPGWAEVDKAAITQITAWIMYPPHECAQPDTLRALTTYAYAAGMLLDEIMRKTMDDCPCGKEFGCGIFALGARAASMMMERLTRMAKAMELSAKLAAADRSKVEHVGLLLEEAVVPAQKAFTAGLNAFSYNLDLLDE